MDFSDPYFDATQALLVQKGSGYDSLERSRARRSASRPTPPARTTPRRTPPTASSSRSFEDLALLTAAVKTGEVDAGVNDNGVLYDYADQNPDVEVATEFDTGEQYGFAVAKDGNDELLDAVNEVLAQAEEDGTYEKIFRQYFPDAELTMPE